MKQSKLRRRRVFRFAVLYFVMFIVFMGLIIAPVFVGEKIPASVATEVNGMLQMNLYQPNKQDNDDTDGEEPTGIKNPLYTGKFKSTSTESPRATAAPETDTTNPETADP